MNIDKIEIDKKYKNLKELANLVELEYNDSTNSRKRLIKELERFVRLEKVGRGYIIKEIYPLPKEKKDNRKGNNIYGNAVQTNILRLLQNAYMKDKTLVLDYTKNQFLIALQITNPNYNNYKSKELASYLGIENSYTWEFYNKSFDMILVTSLNNLQKQNKIKWESDMFIAKQDFHILANEKEKEIIKLAEQEVLKTMGFVNKREVNNHNQYGKFKSLVIREIKEKIPFLQYYYKKYLIYNNIGENILEPLENTNLNQIVIKNLLENAEKRHSKEYPPPKNIFEEDKLIRRKSKKYVENVKKIIDTIIDINSLVTLEKIEEINDLRIKKEWEELEIIHSLFGD